MRKPRTDHLRSNEEMGFALALAILDLLRLPKTVNEMQLATMRESCALAAKAYLRRFPVDAFGYDARDVERRLA